jgi:glutamyl-tRNA synthetase
LNHPLQFKRTRIAPTPSGFLHLGNILSFAITIELARKTGAAVLLRIDDLDQERYQDDYVQDIFDTLDFLELPWDEGPRDLAEFRRQYSQVNRLPSYEEALDHLQASGNLFACTCPRSLLQTTGKDGIYPGTCIEQDYSLSSPQVNWRLYTRPTQEITVKTIDGTPITTTLPGPIHYLVVKKKDRMPSYQLASIIDDLYFDVDLVVRGKDLWHSTVAQLYLSQHLPINTFHQTTFYHHALLTDQDGKKLSKTAGATSVRYLKNQGKKKEEVYKLLAQLAGLPDAAVHDRSSLATAFFAQEGI